MEDAKQVRNGIVRYWNDERHFGSVLEIGTGKTFLTLLESIRPDAYGLRYMVESENVTFFISTNKRDGRDMAADVVVAERCEDIEIPDDYREVCVIREWFA